MDRPPAPRRPGPKAPGRPRAPATPSRPTPLPDDPKIPAAARSVPSPASHGAPSSARAGSGPVRQPDRVFGPNRNPWTGPSPNRASGRPWKAGFRDTGGRTPHHRPAPVVLGFIQVVPGDPTGRSAGTAGRPGFRRDLGPVRSIRPPALPPGRTHPRYLICALFNAFLPCLPREQPAPHRPGPGVPGSSGTLGRSGDGNHGPGADSRNRSPGHARPGGGIPFRPGRTVPRHRDRRPPRKTPKTTQTAPPAADRRARPHPVPSARPVRRSDRFLFPAEGRPRRAG